MSFPDVVFERVCGRRQKNGLRPLTEIMEFFDRQFREEGPGDAFERYWRHLERVVRGARAEMIEFAYASFHDCEFEGVDESVRGRVLLRIRGKWCDVRDGSAIWGRHELTFEGVVFSNWSAAMEGDRWIYAELDRIGELFELHVLLGEQHADGWCGFLVWAFGLKKWCDRILSRC